MYVLGWADWLVFWITIVISASIGIIFSLIGGRQKTTKEFLMADRKMSILPVALSLIVSHISAILILGNAAEIYSYGIQFIMFNVASLTALPVTAAFFVPFVRSLKITSCYEYLERRFNSRATRRLGSFFGIVGSTFYLGTATYAPSIAIETVTGFPAWGSVLITLGVSTFYTSLGGMKAVLWSDTFQFIVMFTGMIAVLIRGLIEIGGFGEMWHALDVGERLNFFVFDPRPTTRHSFWNLVVGAWFQYVIWNAFTQASVQRIASVETDRKAQIAILAKGPFLLLLTIPSILNASVVYTYYTQMQCDPVKMKYVKSPNHLLPYFVMEIMRDLPGLPGVFMATLFSGALSSNSTTLNGISANLWEDFLKGNVKVDKEWKAALINKIIVVVFGIFGIGVAIICMFLQGPITQIALSLGFCLVGPTSGMFIMGIFFPWTTKTGSISGAVVSFAFTVWVFIGKTLNKVRSYAPTLPPIPTSGCPAANVTSYLNGTTASSYITAQSISTVSLADSVSEISIVQATSSELEGVNNLYALSYMLYGVVGIAVAVTVGLIVSFITGPNKAEDVNPLYILPALRRFFYQKDVLEKFEAAELELSEDKLQVQADCDAVELGSKEKC